MTPLAHAAIAQGAGALIAAAAIQIAYPPLLQLPLAAAALQGACAALVAFKLAAPSWWLPIHLFFLPAVLLAQQAGVAPGWYLAGFLLLLLLFWRVDKSRVPLYFSSGAAAANLANLLPQHPCHVADLGCGTGSLLRHLAHARPDCQFYGVEHAPLLWACARALAIGKSNMRIRRGDLWQFPLARFDIVYVFLSPAPMSELIAKARAEMRPGTLLVSNSFPAPDCQPEAMLAVAGRRKSFLYCYRMPGAGDGA